MAKVISNRQAANVRERDQAYNALDCCLTAGVYDALRKKLDPRNTGIVYDFERALQAPAMAMQIRGVRIDHKARNHAIKVLGHGMERTKRVLRATVGDPKFNPASPAQLKKALYDDLGAQKQYSKDEARKLTTNIDAMERIIKKSKRGEPANTVARGVLQYRNYQKQRSTLKSRLSHDGRMRCSFNVGATETGRWSSSANCFREGTNFQNITKRRRNIFIADEGYLLGNRDLSQAESMCVAFLSGDKNYIEAHLDPEVDTHVAVAKLIWPDAEWTGDPAEDLKLAKAPGFYRHFSRRDLSKRIQHGVNYVGSKFTVSRVLHIPQADAQELIDRYFEAFPGIHQWHETIRADLKRYGMLYTPLARKRQFFGRLWDDATVREAVAHVPQSMVGDICNTGLWRIWDELDDGDPSAPGTGNLEILMQGHDAVLFQFKKDRLDLAQATADCMAVEVEIKGKRMVIPTDLEIGTNWRDVHPL